MKAHIQKLSQEIWLIRFGESFKEFGDKYDGVCTFVKKDEVSGYIIGLAGQFNKKSFAAIKEELRVCGVVYVEYERRREDKFKFVRYDKIQDLGIK